MEARLGRALYCLRILHQQSTPDAAKTAYFAYFHAVATYGILLWGASPQAERIFLKQKKAVRVLCNLQSTQSCKSYFTTSKILTIPSVYILGCIEYAHHNINKYTKHEEIHNFNTRNRSLLMLPRHRINLTTAAADYWAAKLYNKLPRNMRNKSPTQLKRILKNHLIHHSFYSLEEFLRTPIHEDEDNI